jgi:hypothetical protein
MMIEIRRTYRTVIIPIHYNNPLFFQTGDFEWILMITRHLRKPFNTGWVIFLVIVFWVLATGAIYDEAFAAGVGHECPMDKGCIRVVRWVVAESGLIA